MTQLEGESSTEPVADLTSDEKTWGMLAHILAIVAGFLAPLVIYLVKKDESEFVKGHARESLNFQITVTLAMIVCTALFFLIIPLLLAAAIGVGALVLAILAGLKANEGRTYRYPFCLRLVK